MISIKAFLTAVIVGLCLVSCAKKPAASTAPPVPLAAARIPLTPQCDTTLWNHVYHGTFSSAKDRLKVLNDCTTVTGTIINAAKENDGDFHVRLDVDPEFKNLLNDKNISDQHGFLVIEPICENKVTQADTILERVCRGFKQTVFKSNMLNTTILNWQPPQMRAEQASHCGQVGV